MDTSARVVGVDRTTNWAGNVAFSARRVHRPGSVERVQELVARSERVRALGSGHSFSPIADTTGDLVLLDGLPGAPEIRGDRVRLPGGTRFAELAPALHAAGRALPNLGSLPHIAVAGACATGTHGSGDALGVLATSVTALELVRADGSLVELRRGDAAFAGSVVGLGAAGIVVGLELATVPTFTVRQWVVEDVPLDVPVAGLLGAARSVSLFTRTWTRYDQVWVKSTAEVPPDLPGRPAGAHRHMTAGEPPENCTAQLGEPGPWHERLPHFRAGFRPSSGAELQSEWFVDRADADAALRAVAALAARIAPVLLVSEVRSVAADDLWLSGAYDRDAVAIHFTWRPDAAAVLPVVAAVEAALEPFAARPHWGKVFTTPAARLRELHPRLPDAVALFAEHDPAGKLRNAMLDALLPA
jgi:alditol oxidase